MTVSLCICDTNTHISACRWKGKVKDYGGLIFLWTVYFQSAQVIWGKSL